MDGLRGHGHLEHGGHQGRAGRHETPEATLSQFKAARDVGARISIHVGVGEFGRNALSEKLDLTVWRDGYEQNWRNYFDPIAIRIGTSREKLTTDVTVMPLIEAADTAPLFHTHGAQTIEEAIRSTIRSVV